MTSVSGKGHEPRSVAGRRDLLTPTRFAEKVGATTTEIFRLHQRGAFRAAVSGGRGRGNQRLYTPEQVAECKLFLKGRVPLTNPNTAKTPYSDITAEDAKVGFQALRDGKSLESLVLEEGLHPDTVIALTHAWSKLTGAVVLSTDAVQKICALPLNGPMPVQSEDDVVEVLTLAANDMLCQNCKKHHKSICRKCVIDTVTELRERDKAEAAAPLATPAEAAASAPSTGR